VNALATREREDRVGLGLAAQFVTQVRPATRKQCMDVISFLQAEEDDLERLRIKCGTKYRDAVRRLRPGACEGWNVYQQWKWTS